MVEDSEECQLVVKHSLSSSKIDISIAASRSEAKALTLKHGAQYDLVILDLMLPDGDAFKVLEDLKTAGLSNEVPIYFLTSKDEIETKVAAFNVGVDDYLVKPINPLELRARIEMRLKKASTPPNDTIRKGQLVLEMNAIRASRLVDRTPVDMMLTSKEFKILSFLVQNGNRVFSRAQLVEAAWGKDVHILDRTVDSHICGLRKKMGPLAAAIESLPGEGYQFNSRALSQVSA